MSSTVTEESLKKHGWGGLSLRPYQLEGVQWLVSCYSNNHGCILGDEMGLGKTCQTIAALTWLKQTTSNRHPHLVVCPRSVLENWCQEFDRFAPGLRVQCYAGDKEKRADMMQSIKRSRQGLGYNFDVLLTTYEICLKDYLFLQSLSWHVLVVDEGHRLKNSQSLLYQTLEQWDIDCRVLLTGTPVQNDLGELYSLLSFVDKKRFKPSRADDFIDQYTSATTEKTEELHSLLKPYLLRRTKAGVLPDLPDKSDVVLFHGLSQLQKRLYKAVLTKDIKAFENTAGTGHTRLMNILMQLRKCVNHPYLFDGVEPEPFEVGEHLVESSGKLMLIDCLLRWLKAREHKVLLFSQMTHMLDILQDYLTFRGFTYERLDGSVRGEERFLAVQNFNKNDETFVFLLSTKAGGQGLNLTAADTVVFVDSDFNPQNDLQAAARAHRIGQNRPVKVIRLVGRNTVEEIILRRAEEKLKLTEAVIEKGEFDTVEPSSSSPFSVCKKRGQLQDILKFGMDKLLNSETEEEDVDFDNILGLTVDGHWQTAEDGAEGAGGEGEVEKEMEKESPQTMYVFEGHDYSKNTSETSAADREAFSTLLQMSMAEEEESASRERSLRKHGTVALSSCLPESLRRPRTKLTPVQLQARKEKRQAEAEAKAQRASEERQRQKEQLWKKYAYTSVNMVMDSEGEEAEELAEVTELDDDDVAQQTRAIHYVIDNSGYWGKGGLFSAISSQSRLPQQQYELAGKVKDLTLGDCHLVPMMPQGQSCDEEDASNVQSNSSHSKNMVALIIAQSRGRNNQLSGIKLSALQQGLQTLYFKARQLKASVHLPRIGHDTPLFNWYGTERLIHKILVARGIPVFVYYFARKKAVKRQRHSTDSSTPSPVALKPDDSDGLCVFDDEETSASSKHRVASTSSTIHHLQLSALVSKPASLPDYFSGIAVHLYDIPLDEMTKYKRSIIAFDGDVDSIIHSRTTHLVVSPNSDKQAVRDVLRDHSCYVVTSRWLDQCLKQQRLVDAEAYLFSL